MKTRILLFVLLATAVSYAQVRGQAGDASTTMRGHSAGAASSAPPRPDPYKQPPEKILDWNPKISAKLATLLPEGMTAAQACAGFKRMGDCGAAIHASQNLGIPFADLKPKLIGQDAQLLVDVIQSLKPDVQAKKEAKKAENQADKDLWDARVM